MNSLFSPALSRTFLSSIPSHLPSSSSSSTSISSHTFLTTRQQKLAQRIDRFYNHQRYTDVLVLIDVFLRSFHDDAYDTTDSDDDEEEDSSYTTSSSSSSSSSVSDDGDDVAHSDTPDAAQYSDSSPFSAARDDDDAEEGVVHVDLDADEGYGLDKEEDESAATAAATATRTNNRTETLQTTTALSASETRGSVGVGGGQQRRHLRRQRQLTDEMQGILEQFGNKLREEALINVSAHYSLRQAETYLALQQPDAAVRVIVNLLNNQVKHNDDYDNSVGPTDEKQQEQMQTRRKYKKAPYSRTEARGDSTSSPPASLSTTTHIFLPKPTTALTSFFHRHVLQVFVQKMKTLAVVAKAATERETNSNANATQTTTTKNTNKKKNKNKKSTEHALILRRVKDYCSAIERERTDMAARRARLMIRATFTMRQWKRCLEACAEGLQIQQTLLDFGGQRKATIVNIRQLTASFRGIISKIEREQQRREIQRQRQQRQQQDQDKQRLQLMQQQQQQQQQAEQHPKPTMTTANGLVAGLPLTNTKENSLHNKGGGDGGGATGNNGEQQVIIKEFETKMVNIMNNNTNNSTSNISPTTHHQFMQQMQQQQHPAVDTNSSGELTEADATNDVQQNNNHTHTHTISTTDANLLHQEGEVFLSPSKEGRKEYADADADESSSSSGGRCHPSGEDDDDDLAEDKDEDKEDEDNDSDSGGNALELVVEAHVTAARVNVIATGNTQSALFHFQSALRQDPLCSIAFKGIVDSWLLPPRDQVTLVDSLAALAAEKKRTAKAAAKKSTKKSKSKSLSVQEDKEEEDDDDDDEEFLSYYTSAVLNSYYSAILGQTPLDSNVLGVTSSSLMGGGGGGGDGVTSSATVGGDAGAVLPQRGGDADIQLNDNDNNSLNSTMNNNLATATTILGVEPSSSSSSKAAKKEEEKDDTTVMSRNNSKKKKKKQQHNRQQKEKQHHHQPPLHLLRYRQALMAFQGNDLPRANACLIQGLREAPGGNAAAAHEPSVCLRLATLVDQRATSELFDFAHSVAEEARHTALAAYSIGCFYYAVANFDQAGRFFCRATEIEPMFAPGWIAYGHTYSRLEESECSLSAYRRAQTLFPGLLDAKLFLGMQYSRCGNFPLARCFLWEAYEAAPHVPLVLNELGVLAFRNGQYEEAYQYLMEARAAQQRRGSSSSLNTNTNTNASTSTNTNNTPNEYEDCIVFNLATLLRKMRQYEEAVELYTLYARLRPYALCAHTALGFTKHLMGNLRAAIEHYHTALALKPDGFTRDLLERALSEEYSHDVGGERWCNNSSGGSDAQPPHPAAAVTASSFSTYPGGIGGGGGSSASMSSRGGGGVYTLHGGGHHSHHHHGQFGLAQQGGGGGSAGHPRAESLALSTLSGATGGGDPSPRPQINRALNF